MFLLRIHSLVIYHELCFQVDAHNIVPCWEASDKLEYAARTIRPKITNKLTSFLTEFPAMKTHPYPVPESDCKVSKINQLEIGMIVGVYFSINIDLFAN